LQETLGIAGSGTIGCGLAALASAHGDVVLWARSAVSAARAETRIADLGASADAARVRVVTDLSELTGESTFVVEAVAEDAEAKGSLLARMAREASAETVLATTTSSLSIAELGRASGRPERFVGLHVFNPVTKMALVELVFADEVDETTRARTRDLCEALGKTAIEVPDLPGFVVNRLLFPFLFSAVELLEETELSPADVDACLALGAGHPMGPLKLLDFVGLDVAEAIGESIGAPVPGRLRALVSEGALGRKAGRGFHSYAR
jgi:3-hydroxybutyryl-CoA dehydrogenase